MKLNILLAITDTLRSKYKNMVSDYSKFFMKSQGSFLGAKATYAPKEDAIDDPSKRGYQLVITTVDEKIQYFIKESSEFIDSLFSQEKTNSTGLAKSELIINDNSWGEFTSLELLRLKSLIESSDLGDLGSLLGSIPVRSDSQLWLKSSAEEYKDRNVWETERISGISRTTEKEEYILPDPNIKAGKIENYTPKVAVRTTTIEIGDYTQQYFSGQWSHRRRSIALKRKNDLLVAIIKSLKQCNECETIKSELTANKIFDYIFYGS